MMSKLRLGLIVFVALFMALFAVANRSTGKLKDRSGKLLSLFEIIEFPNDPCVGSNGRNGTCYTSTQCSDRGGTSGGTCANGYGVCCTFTLQCGGMSSENCTFFESQGNEVGSCTATICPCNDDICQIRLDFLTFSIAGPSTSTATSLQLLNGQPLLTANAVPATDASRCLSDTFSVTNPNSLAPPVICGINSGEHLYVDSNVNCNLLAFQLGSELASSPRTWRIKATQYSCSFENLAPTGCDQYFFGSETNTVRTFNFNNGNGQHLANQDQNICVRRERDTCRICWSATANEDFMLSGKTATAQGFTGTSCCGYGTNGMNTNGYDCLIIPSATQQAMAGMVIAANAFCGRSVGIVSIAGTTATTVCSRRTPFEIRFISDQFEFQNEAGKADRGFQLGYALSGSGC